MANFYSLLAATLLPLAFAASFIAPEEIAETPGIGSVRWIDTVKFETRPHDCLNVISCLIDYPGSIPAPPGVLQPGLLIQLHRRARRGDQYCPSGRCYILDPGDLCDGWGPYCLPIHNLRRPLLPCDPRNPQCPSGGIYVSLDHSCHPFDIECDEGGVYVPPQACPGCPTGYEIPDWFVSDGPSFNVTLPLTVWTPPSIDHGSGRPGVIFDPNKICPGSVEGCGKGDGVVFDPVTYPCRIGDPMCIGVDRLRGCARPKLPVSLCPSGNCLVCPLFPVHPNDNSGIGIVVPPIPCRPGTKGCYGNLGRLPSPIIPCVAGLPGCKGGWQVIPDPDPNTAPDGKPIPPGHSLLVPDQNGDLRCSYIDVLPPTRRPLMPPVEPGSSQSTMPTGRDPTPGPETLLGKRPSPAPQPSTEEPTAQPADQKPIKSPDQPAASNSKFACTTDDKSPCKGKSIRGWRAAGNYWDWSGEHAKPNMPKRTALSDSYFAKPAILEVVDSWFNNAHYTVWVDGQAVAETDEKELKNNRISCGAGDDCVAKGFSHAWVPIPEGNHKIEVGQTKGYVNGDNNNYIYAFTQFQTRLWEQCDPNNC